MPQELPTHIDVPPHNPDCDPCLQRALDITSVISAVREIGVRLMKQESDTEELLKLVREIKDQVEELEAQFRQIEPMIQQAMELKAAFRVWKWAVGVLVAVITFLTTSSGERVRNAFRQIFFGY